MTAGVSVQSSDTRSGAARTVAFLRRYAVWIAFFLVVAFFAVFAERFATTNNALNIASQSVILMFVALAMTLVVTAGGIDLSVGVSFDFAALAGVSLLVADVPWPLAIAVGLGFGTLVGVFNAGMIVKVGTNPFLATLAMLFIGESVQRIYTTGGAPIYVAVMEPPTATSAAARSSTTCRLAGPGTDPHRGHVRAHRAHGPRPPMARHRRSA